MIPAPVSTTTRTDSSARQSIGGDAQILDHPLRHGVAHLGPIERKPRNARGIDVEQNGLKIGHSELR